MPKLLIRLSLLSTLWMLPALCLVEPGGRALGQAEQTEQADDAAETEAAEVPETTSPLDENGHLVQFGRDIAPILRARCLECHGPEDAKNDFRVDDPDSMLSYIEPEDAESSTLYVDYLTTDDEDMLMPPPSHGGPLLPPELALIRVWIQEGAEWPEGYQFTEPANPVLVVTTTSEPRPIMQRVWAAQGYLHPATVHFPIALLTLGAGFVVLGWKWPSIGTQIPLACLLLGSVSAIGATMMGWSFAAEQGYGSWYRFDQAAWDSEVFWHRWSGVIVSILSLIFAVIALWSLRKPKSSLTKVWKVGLLVCAGIVGAVGHQGGEMRYGKDFYPKAWRTLTGTTEQLTLQADSSDELPAVDGAAVP